MANRICRQWLAGPASRLKEVDRHSSPRLHAVAARQYLPGPSFFSFLYQPSRVLSQDGGQFSEQEGARRLWRYFYRFRLP